VEKKRVFFHSSLLFFLFSRFVSLFPLFSFFLSFSFSNSFQTLTGFTSGVVGKATPTNGGTGRREKLAQKNNGSELYRMFAQVKLAQQKRICVCVRCVCAKIVLSKYFVCVVFVRVWTTKKKNMPVDGARESVLAFFGYFLLFVRSG